MKIRYLFIILLLILLFLVFCSGVKDEPVGKNAAGEKTVQKKDFSPVTNRVKIKESIIYNGFLLASSPGDNRFYVEAPSTAEDNTIPLSVINKENGTVEKKVLLNKADFLSEVDVDNPAQEYYPPSYIGHPDNCYYIVGRFSTIVTFDRDFKPLYAGKFQKSRYFISFFKRDGNLQFAAGERKETPEGRQMSISLYRLFKYKKIKKQRTIFETPVPGDFSSFYPEGIYEKTMPAFNILPALFGFVKNGKLYYSTGAENKIGIYHLDTGKTTVFELAYLKGREYTKDQVEKVKMYRIPPALKKSKYYGGPPFPGKIFHLGLIDAGEDKIGLIGDLDIEKMVLRLDILNAATFDYIDSIGLPCGISFLQGLERGPALFPIFVDYDKKIYIRGDWEGEKPDFIVKFSRFAQEFAQEVR
jgi:hypothetical protein